MRKVKVELQIMSTVNIFIDEEDVASWGENWDELTDADFEEIALELYADDTYSSTDAEDLFSEVIRYED